MNQFFLPLWQLFQSTLPEKAGPIEENIIKKLFVLWREILKKSSIFDSECHLQFFGVIKF